MTDLRQEIRIKRGDVGFGLGIQSGMPLQGRDGQFGELQLDNFTHSLAGWALGQTGLKMRTRKGLAALVLGANLPDIDVVFGHVPWAPLATHRGFTHGLVGGVLILPAMLAGLLLILDRWQVSRGTSFRSGLAMNPRWLLLLSYLGALTHPLLDLQTSYAVQLLSPFSTIWFHTESLFIIDAVIWTVLPLTIWLSRKRERQGLPWRRPAIAGLAIICTYIALNGAISLAARQALARHLGGKPEVAYANEEPVLFWRRTLIWRNRGMVGQARYDPLRASGRISMILPPVSDNMDDPAVRQAIRMDDPRLRPFLRWSTMPVAIVDRGKCDVRVTFGDARFLDRNGNGFAFRTVGPFNDASIAMPSERPGCS